ncbi:MAG: aspartate dehydrogenase [Kiloniellales bacterium]|nr:aspartate dehydrogenase [Kiloniellales bacterium]
MTEANRVSLGVAVGGFGAIGRQVARALDRGVPGLRLVAVSARDREAAGRRMSDFAQPVPVVALDELAGLAEVVVECVPAAAFADLAEPAVAAGRRLVTVSCGVLLRRWDLVERAKASGAQIVVPSGALLGLDAVRAAAEGEIHAVRMVTRKPPVSLAGAPYLEQQGIDLEGLTEPRLIFRGTAREGALGFPANVNVAAALSLAGIGPERTELEIWADPALTRNTHRIEVDADSARFEMQIENLPSEANPRTGKITALSVIATLRGLTAPLRVGA